MLSQAVTVTETDDDRRSAERLQINQLSTLRDESRTACEVYVRDLSETGFNIATDVQLTLGSEVTIGLPGHGRATARVVRRVAAGYGCEFLAPLSMASLNQVFRGNNVVSLTSSEPMVMPFAEPQIDRLPGAVRVGVILGSSALLWLGIARAIAALF